jgi:hypothetical protein
VADQAIGKKIGQAEFHLEKLRQPESEIAAESHFSALLACVRTVVMYVHEWQVQNRRAANAKDWACIHAWEQTLPTDDCDAWRALTELRNDDIHEEPVVPFRTRRGGYSGNYFGPDYMGNLLGGQIVRQVNRPSTGADLDVLDVAERSIRVVKRLLADYRSL